MALIAPRRERLIRSAERLVAKGRLQAAIAEYRKVLDKNPDDTNTLNRVGDLYARLNKIDDAVDLFRQIAEYYTQDGFLVKAIAIYKKILRLDSSQLPVYDALAVLYRHQGLISEARAQYRVLAEDQRARGDLDGARELHQKLLEFEPDGLGNMTVLVEIFEQQGEVEAALDGYRFMISCLVEGGDHEGAARVRHKALEKHPGDTTLPSLGEISPVVSETPAGATIEAEVDEEQESVGAVPGDRASTAREVPPPPADTADKAAGELEFVLDLQALEQESTAPETPEAKAAAPVVAEAYSLDLEQLERSIATPPAPSSAATDEPLDEADIFLKYGLHDKAADCLRDILAAAPDHVGALTRTIRLHLGAGRNAQVVAPARRLAALAAQDDDLGTWGDLSKELIAAGFRVEGEKVQMPPDAERVVPPAAGAAETISEAVGSEVGWLDDLLQDGAREAPVELFEGEDEFFDLAAELEDELNQDVELSDDPPADFGAAPTLDRIVDGFRQKISESLSPTDYDTHYNLGIAYREMGLLDEAISEFQLAAKDSRYLVDCCSLLGASFLEKGFPDLAVKWYRRGLESPVSSDSERLGLLYELGTLFESIGDGDSAREALAEISATDSSYRDVAARLDRLGPPTGD